MNSDWLAVFDALKSVYADGTYSNVAVDEAAERHPGCRVSFVRMFAKGVVRDTFRLDFIADSLAEKGVRSIRQRTLIIIRMGIYAADSLGSVPDHAAVSEAVSLAKRAAKGTDRFVNGMLRSYLRRRNEFEPDKLEPHIRYSFSREVFSLLEDQYGDEACRIAEALNTPPELYLRTNTLRTSRDELMEMLHLEGIEAEAESENSEAVKARGSGITGGELYRKGYLSVQSLSSMIAVKALSPGKGKSLLDLCAAPGGKTAYAAELMKNEGSITACDIYPHRLDVTRAQMERLGIDICSLYECDASVYEPSFEESFDFVIADVPCSGLGVTGSKPEIKLTTDPSEYAGLAALQERILDNAVRYTRPGGRLMYSTCTLNRRENEEVVKHILSKHSVSTRIIELETLLPYNGKVGFFYCIIGKNPT